MVDISTLEAEWSKALQGVSFVSQVIDNDEHVESAMLQLGRMLRRAQDKAQRRNYYRLYPASFLVVMTHFAGENWGPDGYWAKLVAAMQIPDGGQTLYTEFGEIFRNGLDQFGLDRHELPLKNLGEILLQATIPASNQTAFINRLAKAYSADEAMTADSFNDAIRTIPESSVQATGLGKATWHFMHQAPEFASYFTQQCIDFLDDIQDGVWDENGGVGLPPRVLNELRAIADRGEIRLGVKRNRFALHQKPKVRLDPLTNQLFVELPSLPGYEKYGIQWTITTDEESFEEFVPPHLAGLTYKRASVPLRQPTTQVIVEGEGLPFKWPALRLYDSDDHLIVFDAKGRLIQSNERLPADVVYILCPKVFERGQVDVVVPGHEALEMQRLGAPVGWERTERGSNWQLIRLGFNPGMSSVGIAAARANGESKQLGRMRLFSRPETVTIQLESHLVAYTKTTDGLPVLSSLPSLALPGDASSDETTWKVSLRNSEGQLVSYAEYLPDPSDSTVHLDFNAADGVYEVNLERRRGRGSKARFALVSGLKVEVLPEYRTLAADGSGLVPAEIGIEINGKSFANRRLDRTAISADLSLSEDLNLVITPDHFSMIMESANNSKQVWGAVRLWNETISTVKLRLSGRFPRKPKLVFLRSREVVHTLWPTSYDQSLVIFSLQGVADSIRVAGSASVFLTGDNQDEFIVATCSPEKLFSDLEYRIRDAEINLVCDAIPENLEVAFYSTFGLLDEPIVKAVTDRKIAIPVDIHELGPFGVTFKVTNPWAFEQWPQQFRNGVNSKQFDGRIPDGGEPIHSFVRWMITGEKEPGLEALPQRLYWRLLTEAPQAPTTVKREEVTGLAAENLDGDPTAAFENFPGKLAERDSYLKLLFLADIVDELPEQPVERLLDAKTALSMPALFAIAGAGQLIANPDARELAGQLWGLSHGYADGEAAQVWHLSKAAMSQDLAVKYAPLAGWEPDSVTSFLEESGIIGGGILSPNNWPIVFLTLAQAREQFRQTTSFMKFFSAEEMTKFESEFKTAALHNPVATKMAALRPVASPEQERRIAGLGKDTVNVPAASVRLALLARMAARGNFLADELWHKHKKIHQHISFAAPKLTELDLVIAELALSGLE